MDIRKILASSLLFLLITQISQGQIIGKVTDIQNKPQVAFIYADGTGRSCYSDTNGNFELSLKRGTYTIVCFSEGFQSQSTIVKYSGEKKRIDFNLSPLSLELKEVIIEGSRAEDLGMKWLQSIEGAAIFESKKTELINIEELVGNLAINSSRQVYARVPGLNIFENDGAGLQLAIGARGLDPNRTSNFNVRQNGYDISADALGYPESYYTPPVQALQRIEIVRGAAGLQYGSQFGGLLNFKFKEGPEDKKVEFNTYQTIGSYKLFNSFNSLGGTVNKSGYYGFFQYKTLQGWRPNSDLDQQTGYLSFAHKFNPFFKIKSDFTSMSYIAHQPGGLTDAQFNQDPSQSNRSRNWFQVNWRIGSISLDYRINSSFKINNRTFFLKGNRDALGNLERIDRLDDPTINRNLIKDEYNNWGNEIRAIFHYEFFGNKSILLIGNRYYEGLTNSAQGDGTVNDDADFNFINAEMPDDSEFRFPSRNISFFAENIFNISKKFSITPGIRYEFIETKASGYYTNQVLDFAGNLLQDTTIFEQRIDPRNIVLIGLGLSYRFKQQVELYSNFSQNYRGINFTDIRIDNPSLQVDPDISDESGFNIDLGIRGELNKKFAFDGSLFFLSYEDRIGNSLVTKPDPNFGGLISRTITFRTNIGDANIYGFEAYLQYDFMKSNDKVNDGKVNVFANMAYIKSIYQNITSGVLEGVQSGNEVELVPTLNTKIGLNYKKGPFKSSLLYTYVSDQFSDAANTDPATSTAIQGVIPSYGVADASFNYKVNSLSVDLGVNNIFDSSYFTRRATGYPGPGIIPAEPRTFYLTVGYEL